MSLEFRGEVQAGELHLGGVGQRWRSSQDTERSEVLGLGKGRWEGVQAGRSAQPDSRRQLERGLEGLAGPVKRFGLSLTDNAEPE